MEKFKQIYVEAAQKLIPSWEVTIVDVRDPAAYQTAHIEGAVAVDDQNINEFLAKTPKDKPLICYCYHGFSSQNAAQFFSENGFADVYSVEGGFEEWKKLRGRESDPKILSGDPTLGGAESKDL